jgi:hypothetical protein
VEKSNDVIPGPTAEWGLSQFKKAARTEQGGISEALAKRIIPLLQEAIDSSVQKHMGDGGLEVLRNARAAKAKEAGAEWLADQFGKAQQEGGFGHEKALWNSWVTLTNTAKRTMFSPAQIAELDKFFMGLKMRADNPNPSGTALVGTIASQASALGTAAATGQILNPMLWISQLGIAGFAKLLRTDFGVKLLTDGLTIPRTSSRGKFIEGKLKKILGELPQGPQEPPAGAGRGANNPPAGFLESLRTASPQSGMRSGRASTEPVDFPSHPARLNATFDLGVVNDVEHRIAGEPGEGQADVAAPGSRARAGAPEAQTEIRIPGAKVRYKAFYEVRELADLQPSHSGHTFQRNERYQLKNDRDYSRSENQGKIVDWSGPDFDPSYHITDNPDASNGPPVIDEVGNVYGGNGRTMILQRVYSGNRAGAEAYRQMLLKKASQFGLDPKQIEAMKEPVLVRVIPDEEMAAGGSRQQAVTDFNKTGTAALRGSEKAIADSRRVSLDTLDDIAARLEEKGADATLAEVLEGRGGAEVFARLVEDGVITPQESAAYVDRGVLTAEGKARISKLLLGRFFRDPAQLDMTPPSIRAKLERIAAPLAKVEGRANWSLSERLQEAIDLIEEAKVRGQKNLDDVVAQSGLFGSQKYSPAGVQLAKILRDANPNELTKAVRQYAADAAEAERGPGLFGEPPTARESFEAAFSALSKKHQ